MDMQLPVLLQLIITWINQTINGKDNKIEGAGWIRFDTKVQSRPVTEEGKR